MHIYDLYLTLRLTHVRSLLIIVTLNLTNAYLVRIIMTLSHKYVFYHNCNFIFHTFMFISHIYDFKSDKCIFIWS